MNQEITFGIAIGAAKHFGKNLYTSNPPAIAELIANAWDAYAENVHVFYEKNKTHNDKMYIVIYDDGIGMSFSDLKERYAISGRPKDTTQITVPEGKHARPYMGKKGIGKFATFSLGENYKIITKTKEDTLWNKLELKYSEFTGFSSTNLKVPVEFVAEIDSELNSYINQDDLKSLNYNVSGTFIIIPCTWRSMNEATVKGMEKLLSRRFSPILCNNHQFKIIINKTELILKNRYYYRNLEFVYFFDKTANNQFQIIRQDMETEKSNIVFEDVTQQIGIEHDIFGWIGTVSKPSDLSIENENTSAGVVVFINGKLADENILKHRVNKMISNAYIVGEIFYDYLDEIEDVVLSNREGLNQAVEEVQCLVDTLDNIRNILMQNWGKLRSSRSLEKQTYMDIITRKNRLNQLFLSLNNDKQKWVTKIMQHAFDHSDLVHQDDTTNEQIAESIILIAMDNDLHDMVKQSAESNIDFQILTRIFNILDMGTYLRLKATNRNKFEIISLLEKLVDEEEIEKAFENHLFKNPWLINPSWDISPNSITKQRVFTNIKEYIENGEKKQIEESGRTDILLTVVDEQYPIIVELKREKKTGYSSPKVGEIMDQIRKYREGIIQAKERLNLDIDMQEKNKIRAYFICGEEAYTILEKNGDIDTLKGVNINVTTYQKLISTALSIFASDKDRIVYQNNNE